MIRTKKGKEILQKNYPNPENIFLLRHNTDLLNLYSQDSQMGFKQISRLAKLMSIQPLP